MWLMFVHCCCPSKSVNLMNGVHFTNYQGLHYDIFCAVVDEFSKDLNQFDKTKHTCALCGDIDHPFSTCLEINHNVFCDAYL